MDGRTIILARRRLGRGGRIILDRRVPPYKFYVDSSILREIQSRAVGDLRESWCVDAENLDDGSVIHHELSVPETQAPEEKEVVYIRGKKSFSDHLNEIRYSREENDSDLLGYQRICL